MHLRRDEDTIGFAKRYKGHYLLENNVHTSNLDFTAKITEIESDEGDLNVETGPKASEGFETGEKSPTQIICLLQTLQRFHFQHQIITILNCQNSEHLPLRYQFLWRLSFSIFNFFS